MSRYLSQFLIKCVTVYVKHRPRTYPMCRFMPSCSEYAIRSLGHLGILRAIFYITLRLLRCHPWSGMQTFCIDEPKIPNKGEK